MTFNFTIINYYNNYSMCSRCKYCRWIGKMRDTASIAVSGGDKSRQTTASGRINGSRGSTPATTGSSARRKDETMSVATTKNQSKMLLRELCVDKVYLENLTADPSNINELFNSFKHLLEF